MLAKIALLDKIHSYPLTANRVESPEAPGETGPPETTPGEKARDIAEEAKRLMTRGAT